MKTFLFVALMSLSVFACPDFAAAASLSFTPGTISTFVVPAGVRSITISGGGGGGGGGTSCVDGFSNTSPGGDAASSTLTYAVTPGESLQVEVQSGGTGGCGLGAGGGGAGGSAFVTGPGVNFASVGGTGAGANWWGRHPCFACGGNGGDAAISIFW